MKTLVAAFSLSLLMTIPAAIAQNPSAAPPDLTGSVATGEGSVVAFTKDQQLELKKLLAKQNLKESDIGQKVSVGATIPGNVELQRVPDSMGSVPAVLQNYRYVMIESQVAVVDPNTRRIIQIIPE